MHAQSTRSQTSSQNIDQGESSGHQTKPKTNNIRQDVLVGEDLGLLILSQLLEIGISFVQEKVDEEPE